MININYFLQINNLSNCLWLIIIAAGRFYGAMLICPLFSNKYLPTILKLALALICAAIMLPYFPKLIMPNNSLGNIILLAKELLYGSFLGYLLGIPFWLIESIGNLIDLQRGEEMGAAINNLTNTPESSISKLLLQGFITYFAAFQGLIFFFNIIIKSFNILKITQFIPQNSIHIDAIIGLFSTYFYWVVILVLPILALLFLIDVVMGIMGAFLPQLNITLIDMPIKSAVAMLLLVFYIGILYHQTLTKFINGFRGLYG